MYLPYFAPMIPGFDYRSRHLCAFDFQSKLATWFSPGAPVFPLAFKSRLLDKSVSGVS